MSFERLSNALSSVVESAYEKVNAPDFLRIREEDISSTIKTTINLMNSEGMKRIYSTAKETLNILDKTKTANLVSLVAAGVSSAELVTKLIYVERRDALNEFVKSLGPNLITVSRKNQARIFICPFVMRNFSYKTVFTPDEHTQGAEVVRRYEYGENNFLYLHGRFPGEGKFVLNDMWIDSEKFSYEKAYEAIWSLVGSKAYLIVGGNGLEINPLKVDLSSHIIDEDEVNDLVKEITSARKMKISRSYLLVGPPGTGKTSLGHIVADRCAPRIIKIDPSVLESLGSGDLDSFVDAIKPDCLILDDIDRVSANREGFLLSLLESIKTAHPEVVIFASANNWHQISAALKRPGRFDRIVSVEAPKFGLRKVIFQGALQKVSITLDDELFVMLVEGTRGFSHAYLMEIVNRLRNSMNYEHTIKQCISEFRKSITGYCGPLPRILVHMPHIFTDMPVRQQEDYFDTKYNPILTEEEIEEDEDSAVSHSSYYY